MSILTTPRSGEGKEANAAPEEMPTYDFCFERLEDVEADTREGRMPINTNEAEYEDSSCTNFIGISILKERRSLGIAFMVLLGISSFILGCVSTTSSNRNRHGVNGASKQASRNSESIESINEALVNLESMFKSMEIKLNEISTELHTSNPICPTDITWGQVPTAGPVNGTFFQVAGTPSDKTLTWADARNDASSRCFNGHQGFLASISTEEEDDYLTTLLADAIKGVSLAEGDAMAAWTGGSAMNSNGDFLWVGPGDEGSHLDDGFTNWADGEPNNKGDSRSEGCVAKYIERDGTWNDLNCYTPVNFFIVKFDLKEQ